MDGHAENGDEIGPGDSYSPTTRIDHDRGDSGEEGGGGGEVLQEHTLFSTLSTMKIKIHRFAKENVRSVSRTRHALQQPREAEEATVACPVRR